MKRHWLSALLAFSLLLNVGVLAAFGYQAWQDGKSDPGHKHDQLVKHLGLTDEQQRQWREKEEKFLREMGGSWEEVRVHRERMIREIFSEKPDLAVIESDRAAISRLQEKQQREVIKQLMEEQHILNPRQRDALAALLLQQTPASSLEERLHSD